MMGLHSTNFPSMNTITLSEDVLVQKFTSLSPQQHISFIQGIQRPEYILSALNFPFKSYLFQTLVQLILSMYSQVLGLYHDQGIYEAFLGFLMFLSEFIKFDYPKFISNSMHEHLTNFNSLRAFKYQAYLMYLILNKYNLHFKNLLEPEGPTPYDVVSIIHKASFLKNQPSKFSKFINEFTS